MNETNHQQTEQEYLRIIEAANAAIGKGKKQMALKHLYKAYEIMPKDKLEKRIMEIEMAVIRQTNPQEFTMMANTSATSIDKISLANQTLNKSGYKIWPLRQLANYHLQKGENEKGCCLISSFCYFDQKEKKALFKYYNSQNKPIKALVFLLSSQNYSSFTQNTVLQDVDVQDLDILKTQLGIMKVTQEYGEENFCTSGGIFFLQDHHVKWLSLFLSKEIAQKIIFLYLIELYKQEDFERGNKILSSSIAVEEKILDHGVFRAIEIQFQLQKIIKLYRQRRKMLEQELDRMGSLLLDKKFLNFFDIDIDNDDDGYENFEKKISMIKQGEDREINFLLANNPYLILGVKEDIKINSAKDILKSVASKLKNMSYGTQTPITIMTAQKLLLDKSYQGILRVLYGHPCWRE